MTIRLVEIKSFLDSKGFKYKIQGCEDVYIHDFCSLNKPKDYAITWVKNPGNTALVNFDGNTQNVIITSEYIKNNINKCCFIITENPKKVFFNILDFFWNNNCKNELGNNSTILTHVIGENVKIGCNCFIGEDVEIGDNVTIENNVVIQNKVKIGAGSIIHSGSVIGTDGYGYYYDENRVPHKVSHYGGVIIENEVEIGANTCIDRGTIDDTHIMNNAKIDNLCHIAHNVVVGENVMIIAGSIICGSVTVNDRAYIAPGAIVKNQISVGQDSLIGIGSLALNDTLPNRVYVGSPAKNIRERGNEKI